MNKLTIKYAHVQFLKEALLQFCNNATTAIESIQNQEIRIKRSIAECLASELHNRIEKDFPPQKITIKLPYHKLQVLTDAVIAYDGEKYYLAEKYKQILHPELV